MIKGIRSEWIWVAILMAALLFYFLFDPVKTAWMPQCVFYKVTGLQCMGCGAQRMLHSLLHGDLEGAFHANAFLLFSLPVIVFLLIVEFSRLRFPVLYRRVHSQWLIIIISAMLLAWLVIRNIIGI